MDHRLVSTAMLAVLGIAEAACAPSQTPSRSSPLPNNASPATSSASDSATSSPADGVWRTEGYHWIIKVDHGQAQTFDLTSLSCLPNHTSTQLGDTGTDGAVSFGAHNVATETLRRLPDGEGRLRLLGTAADITLTALPTLPDACTHPTPNDPLTNFDVFWATFAENYNSTTRKHIGWNALRTQYRPMVNATTTPDQLYRILVAMIEPLHDNHTTIDGPPDTKFTGGGIDDTSYEGKRPATRDDQDLFPKDAFKSIDEHLKDIGASNIHTAADHMLAYADLPGSVGYLRVGASQDYGTDHNTYLERRALLSKVLDKVFTPDRVHSWKGLIIDVSWNEGGDDQLALQLDGRLTNTAYLAYTKQVTFRDNASQPLRYGAPRPVTVTPSPDTRYTGPVRLLTSDLTVSAGETFIEALLGRTPTPPRFGTTTQGVFADDMKRKLPNGWDFTVGNEDYTSSNGINYEDLGIPPTTQIPMFTPTQLTAHQDPALDTALHTPW